jgi:hypothetical protein
MKALKKGAVRHRFNDKQIQSVNGLSLILKRYEKFLNVATRAQSTRQGYRRAVRDLCIFTFSTILTFLGIKSSVGKKSNGM